MSAKTDASSVPVMVPNLNATWAGASGDNTCAIASADQAALCWGENVNGQLGDGALVIVTAPTNVVGF